MISITDKMQNKQNWTRNDYNRWADYIEFKCLCDDFVSISDIMDMFTEDDIDNELDRGGGEHHEYSDKLEMLVKDYFRVLKRRSEELGDYYLFHVSEDDSIHLKLPIEEKHIIYLYFLVCSSISYMDKSDLQLHTHDFESVCKYIMRALVSNNAEVELFGTSKMGTKYTGKLRNRIVTLAKDLGGVPSKSLEGDSRFDRIPGGDAGLDIVAYFPLDNAQVIPFSFAQCTCSYEKWKDKQNSIGYEDWRSLIDPLTYYGKYMFVPFSCHDASGKFENVTQIHTFLIDRIRIIKLISKDAELLNKLLLHCKKFVNESKDYEEVVSAVGISVALRKGNDN